MTYSLQEKHVPVVEVKTFFSIKNALSGLRQFMAIASPVRMKKDALYFIKKLFSFWSYLAFCSDFFIMQENFLIRKLRLISKFMTSKTEKQTITIQILPSISGSKDNQTMKFG